MAEADGRPIMMNGLAVYPHGTAGTARVVVVHGSMDRGASFIKAMRRLGDLEFVRYDRRGYGRSVDGGVCGSFSDQVDDLFTVLADQPSVVVGHSLGGLIALAAAQRHPHLVRSLGVFEAPMPWAPWWPVRSAGGDAIRAADDDLGGVAVELFMRRMIGDDRWESLPPATRAARLDEGGALLSDLRGVREGGAPYDVKRIAQPLVVGCGTESDAHHRRGARALAAAASNADLVVVDGAGHGAHFSHPESFARLIQLAVDRADEDHRSAR